MNPAVCDQCGESLNGEAFVLCRRPDQVMTQNYSHRSHMGCKKCTDELSYVGPFGACLPCLKALGGCPSMFKFAGVALRPPVGVALFPPVGTTTGEKMSDAKPPSTSQNISRTADEYFTCPITYDLPANPVLAQDGHVYEKDAIERWFSTSQRSPVTNENIGTALTPIVAVRKMILDVREEERAEEAKRRRLKERADEAKRRGLKERADEAKRRRLMERAEEAMRRKRFVDVTVKFYLDRYVGKSGKEMEKILRTQLTGNTPYRLQIGPDFPTFVETFDWCATRDRYLGSRKVISAFNTIRRHIDEYKSAIAEIYDVSE